MTKIYLTVAALSIFIAQHCFTVEPVTANYAAGLDAKIDQASK